MIRLLYTRPCQPFLFLIGLLVILSSQLTFAQGMIYLKKDRVTFTYSNLNTSKILYVRNSMPVACPDPGGPSNTIKKAELTGLLNLGTDYKFGSNTFTGTVEIEIKGYDAFTGGNLIATYTRTLNISEGGPEQLFNVDFTSIHSTVNRFTVTPQAGYSFSSLVQGSVNLEVFFSEDFKTDVSSSQPLVSLTAKSSVVTENPVPFAWSICTTAPNYHLQLLRLYNIDPAKTSNQNNIKAAVDWNKALNIETGNSTPSYTLTLAEGRGYYLWRVRPIGTQYTGGIANDQNWGLWTATSGANQGDTITITSSTVPSFGFFYEQFDDTLNWIYERSFMEGDVITSSQTAIREQMTYANGLGMVKQNQVHLQSDRTIVASQTIQDFSGRDALVTLPAPLEKNYLAYERKLVKTVNGTTDSLYTANDYDADNNYYAPSIVHSASKLASYYSNLNSDLTIPNAEGYPFSRNTFFKDGTNRIKDQSGVGLTHRTGNGRTTKTSYSSVGDIELVRILGDEAPLHTSVHKIITIDPNQTASVQYISKEGQVIATCLSVNPNDTLLDELPSAAGAAFTVNDTLKSSTDYGNYGITSVKNITFTAPTTLTLCYDITPAVFGDSCTNLPCKTCDYKVSFFVYDVDNPANTQKDSLIISPGNCPASLIELDSCKVFSLNAGDYVVEKRVEAYTANTSTGKAYIDEYLASAEDSLFNYFDAQLATIKGFLERGTSASVDSLYDYLGADADDTLKTVIVGCDTFSIPIIHCQKHNCGVNNDPDFAGYLIDRWSSLYGTSINTYLPGYSTNTQFNDMIHNMLTETTYQNSVYTCDELWDCWDASVQSYKLLKDMYTDADLTFNLLDHFLTCAGYKIEGFTSTAFGTPGYLSHPYAYFNYTAGAHYRCERMFCCGETPNCNTCTQTQFNAFTDSTWNNFYQCVKNVDLNNNDTTETDILAEKTKAEELCKTTCNSRFGSFLQEIIATYHKDSIYVQGDQYYLTGDTLFDQGYVLSGDSLPTNFSNYVPFKQLYCMAQSLVDECIKSCTLTVFQDSISPYLIDSIGSSAEIQAITQVMTGRFELALPDSSDQCPTGFTHVLDSTSSADLLLEYLNRTLETVRDTIGVNGGLWNYLEALLAFDSTVVNLACYDSMVANPYVYVYARGKKSYFQISGASSELKKDSIENTYLKYERIYPKSIMPGTKFTVTTKLTIQESNFNPAILAIDDDIANSHFTLVSGQMYKEVLGNLPSGTVLTTYYTLKADETTPYGNINFVNGTGSLTENGTPVSSLNLSSTINVSDCGSLQYVSPITIIAVPNSFDFDDCFNCQGLTLDSTVTSGTDTLNIPFSSDAFLPPYYRLNLFEVITLCDEFCPDTSSCNSVCIRWFTDTIPDSIAFQINFITCEKNAANTILNTLNSQVAKAVDKHLINLKQSYLDNCTKSANILDNCVLSYQLGYHHYTLLYYDRAGNKIKTVSPKGVVTTATNRQTHPAHTYVTEYAYNSIGQRVREKTPDAGETHMFYNDKGQVRFSVNAKQKLLSLYSYTKYDNLGRIIETGQSSKNYSNDQFLDSLNNSVFPSSNNSERIFTVYTDPEPGFFFSAFQENLQNRVSYTYTDDYATTYFSYDPHGNVKLLMQVIPGFEYFHFISYEYDLIANKVIAVHYNEGLPGEFNHRYKYDADQRIVNQYTNTFNPYFNKFSMGHHLWDNDATYTYYKHGPLKRAAIGEDHVQGLDYVYTLNNQIKAINHPALLKSYDPGQDSITFAKDVFGMVLGYHDNDFNRTNSPFNPNNSLLVSSQTGINNLFNGNISNITLKNAPTSSDTVRLMGFKYRYDQLNRLKKEDYNKYDHINTVWTDPASYYDNRFTYDPNGGIDTLIRYGNGSLMDNMVFNYNTGNNQLNKVNDGVADNAYASIDADGQNADNYEYTAIGERNKDVKNGIDTIKYNVYKKITEIAKQNGDLIKYQYNASQHRINKTYISSSSDTTITYYVRDVSGNIVSIYERTTVDTNHVYKQLEVPIYGTDMVGEYKPGITVLTTNLSGQNAVTPTKDTTYFTRVIAKKEYSIKNYLSDVKVTVSDRKQSDESAKILSYNNTYAYGMPLVGTEMNYTPNSYRFGYNAGSEKDDDIFDLNGTNYTTFFRELDTRIPVWYTTDPKPLEGEGSYNSMSGNPILFSDPNGDCVICKTEFKASASFNFGTKGKSSFSLGAGLGFSASSKNAMGSLNLSARLFSGGLGTKGLGDPQLDFVGTPALTFGSGNASSQSLRTFTSANINAVNNSFKNSITVASNNVLNFGRDHFSSNYQRVGSIGIRSGDVSVSTYNDFFPIIGDRDDRGNTGGGSINIGLGGDNSLTFGTEVFTGERWKDAQGRFATGGSFGGREYYKMRAGTGNYNDGQTFLKLNTSQFTFNASLSGFGQMYSQDVIHDFFTDVLNDPTRRFSNTNQSQSIQLGGSYSPIIK